MVLVRADAECVLKLGLARLRFAHPIHRSQDMIQAAVEAVISDNTVLARLGTRLAYRKWYYESNWSLLTIAANSFEPKPLSSDD